MTDIWTKRNPVGGDKLTRRRLVGWGAASSALAFGGTLLAPGSWRIAIAETKPYKFGSIHSLTGPGAPVGKTALIGVQMAVDRINNAGGIKGRPIHFNIQDDQTSPQIAVQLTNQVIAKKPAVIFGSSLVGVCNAMVPLVKDGPVMYCFSPGIRPPKDGYAFSSSVSTRDLATVLVRYFREKGWHRFALMTSTDATGQDAERNFDEALAMAENKSMQLVAREHFNTTDVSVAAQLAKIKASNPQVFVGWTTGTPFGTVLRGIAEAGLDVPIGAGNGNLTYSQMHQYAPFMPKELYFPGVNFLRYGQVAKGPFKDALDLFYKRLEPTKPDLGQSLAWDPALIVIEALRALGPDATASQLRDYIEKLHGFAGINGIYDFRAGDQRGLGVNNAAVVRWTPQKDSWIAVSKPGGLPL